MILFALVALEVIGWTLVRTHPEIRELYAGNPWSRRFVADLALLGLWPILAIDLLGVKR